MNRRQRARIGAAAILPVTFAGLLLIQCGCSLAAYSVLSLTALSFAVWVFSSRS